MRTKRTSITIITTITTKPMARATKNAVGCSQDSHSRPGTIASPASDRATFENGSGEVFTIARVLALAVCAVAASILTAAYHMLKDGTVYRDLGPGHLDRRSRETQARRLVRRLANLGYAVELAPLEPAPA